MILLILLGMKAKNEIQQCYAEQTGGAEFPIRDTRLAPGEPPSETPRTRRMPGRASARTGESENHRPGTGRGDVEQLRALAPAMPEHPVRLRFAGNRIRDGGMRDNDITAVAPAYPPNSRALVTGSRVVRPILITPGRLDVVSAYSQPTVMFRPRFLPERNLPWQRHERA
jgi:hypothetical protein